MRPREGDRVRLLEMTDDPCPLDPGDEGTVLWVTELDPTSYQVAVHWDSGRTLNLCVPPDRYEVLP